MWLPKHNRVTSHQKIEIIKQINKKKIINHLKFQEEKNERDTKNRLSTLAPVEIFKSH